MWQQETLKRITQAFSGDSSVREVVPLGSLSDKSDIDQWSDLDVGIVVDTNAFSNFYPSTEWINQFGDIYALDQSSAPNKGTSRIVFVDGSRVDFSISSDKDLLQSELPATSGEAQTASLQNLSNEFKFEAFLAVSKVARNDLLIGAHLILGLERKCLVLAMMLRDRELGTVHHRHGGSFNEVVAELKSFGATKNELLDRLHAARRLFEKLAVQLNPNFIQDWEPLDHYVTAAQA